MGLKIFQKIFLKLNFALDSNSSSGSWYLVYRPHTQQLESLCNPPAASSLEICRKNSKQPPDLNLIQFSRKQKIICDKCIQNQAPCSQAVFSEKTWFFELLSQNSFNVVQGTIKFWTLSCTIIRRPSRTGAIHTGKITFRTSRLVPNKLRVRITTVGFHDLFSSQGVNSKCKHGYGPKPKISLENISQNFHRHVSSLFRHPVKIFYNNTYPMDRPPYSEKVPVSSDLACSPSLGGSSPLAGLGGKVTSDSLGSVTSDIKSSAPGRLVSKKGRKGAHARACSSSSPDETVSTEEVDSCSSRSSRVPLHFSKFSQANFSLADSTKPRNLAIPLVTRRDPTCALLLAISSDIFSSSSSKSTLFTSFFKLKIDCLPCKNSNIQGTQGLNCKILVKQGAPGLNCKILVKHGAHGLNCKILVKNGANKQKYKKSDHISSLTKNFKKLLVKIVNLCLKIHVKMPVSSSASSVSLRLRRASCKIFNKSSLGNPADWHENWRIQLIRTPVTSRRLKYHVKYKTIKEDIVIHIRTKIMIFTNFQALKKLRGSKISKNYLWSYHSISSAPIRVQVCRQIRRSPPSGRFYIIKHDRPINALSLSRRSRFWQVFKRYSRLKNLSQVLKISEHDQKLDKNNENKIFDEPTDHTRLHARKSLTRPTPYAAGDPRLPSHRIASLVRKIKRTFSNRFASISRLNSFGPQKCFIRSTVSSGQNKWLNWSACSKMSSSLNWKKNLDVENSEICHKNCKKTSNSIFKKISMSKILKSVMANLSNKILINLYKSHKNQVYEPKKWAGQPEHKLVSQKSVKLRVRTRGRTIVQNRVAHVAITSSSSLHSRGQSSIGFYLGQKQFKSEKILTSKSLNFKTYLQDLNLLPVSDSQVSPDSCSRPKVKTLILMMLDFYSGYHDKFCTKKYENKAAQDNRQNRKKIVPNKYLQGYKNKDQSAARIKVKKGQISNFKNFQMKISRAAKRVSTFVSALENVVASSMSEKTSEGVALGVRQQVIISLQLAPNRIHQGKWLKNSRLQIKFKVKRNQVFSNNIQEKLNFWPINLNLYSRLKNLNQTPGTHPVIGKTPNEGGRAAETAKKSGVDLCAGISGRVKVEILVSNLNSASRVIRSRKNHLTVHQALKFLEKRGQLRKKYNLLKYAEKIKNFHQNRKFKFQVFQNVQEYKKFIPRKKQVRRCLESVEIIGNHEIWHKCCAGYRPKHENLKILQVLKSMKKTQVLKLQITHLAAILVSNSNSNPAHIIISHLHQKFHRAIHKKPDFIPSPVLLENHLIRGKNHDQSLGFLKSMSIDSTTRGSSINRSTVIVQVQVILQDAKFENFSKKSEPKFLKLSHEFFNSIMYINLRLASLRNMETRRHDQKTQNNLRRENRAFDGRDRVEIIVSCVVGISTRSVHVKKQKIPLLGNFLDRFSSKIVKIKQLKQLKKLPIFLTTIACQSRKNYFLTTIGYRLHDFEIFQQSREKNHFQKVKKLKFLNKKIICLRLPTITKIKILQIFTTPVLKASQIVTRKIEKFHTGGHMILWKSRSQPGCTPLSMTGFHVPHISSLIDRSKPKTSFNFGKISRTTKIKKLKNFQITKKNPKFWVNKENSKFYSLGELQNGLSLQLDLFQSILKLVFYIWVHVRVINRIAPSSRHLHPRHATGPWQLHIGLLHHRTPSHPEKSVKIQDQKIFIFRKLEIQKIHKISKSRNLIGRKIFKNMQDHPSAWELKQIYHGAKNINFRIFTARKIPQIRQLPRISNYQQVFRVHIRIKKFEKKMSFKIQVFNTGPDLAKFQVKNSGAPSPIYFSIFEIKILKINLKNYLLNIPEKISGKRPSFRRRGKVENGPILKSRRVCTAPPTHAARSLDSASAQSDLTHHAAQSTPTSKISLEKSRDSKILISKMEKQEELDISELMLLTRQLCQGMENPYALREKLLIDKKITETGVTQNLLKQAHEINLELEKASVGLQSQLDTQILLKAEKFVGISPGNQKDERVVKNGRTLQRPKVVFQLVFGSPTGRWLIMAKAKIVLKKDLDRSTYTCHYPGDENQDAIAQAVQEIESSLDREDQDRQDRQVDRQDGSIIINISNEERQDLDLPSLESLKNSTPKKGILKSPNKNNYKRSRSSSRSRSRNRSRARSTSRGRRSRHSRSYSRSQSRARSRARRTRSRDRSVSIRRSSSETRQKHQVKKFNKRKQASRSRDVTPRGRSRTRSSSRPKYWKRPANKRKDFRRSQRHGSLTLKCKKGVSWSSTESSSHSPPSSPYRNFKQAAKRGRY